MAEHLSDVSDAKQFGDRLLLFLDKCNDFDKAWMIEKKFARLVQKTISADTFWRLAAAIESAYIGDLKTLATPTGEAPEESQAVLSNLFGTRLVKITEPKNLEHMLNGDGPVAFEINDLGRAFIRCISDRA